MPRIDTTGPMGYGPRTGRGLGRCMGNRGPDDISQLPGRGFGRGFGRGRGFGVGMGLGGRARRGGFFEQPTPQDELSVLQNQKKELESQLNAVKQRLEKFATEETQGN